MLHAFQLSLSKNMNVGICVVLFEQDFWFCSRICLHVHSGFYHLGLGWRPLSLKTCIRKPGIGKKNCNFGLCPWKGADFMLFHTKIRFAKYIYICFCSEHESTEHIFLFYFSLYFFPVAKLALCMHTQHRFLCVVILSSLSSVVTHLCNFVHIVDDNPVQQHDQHICLVERPGSVLERH